MAKPVTVWFDLEADFLEVKFSDAQEKNVSPYEAELEAIVARLYELTEAEKAIVCTLLGIAETLKKC
ncbi:MAG: hypothetical protein ACO3EZ_02290 [Prochlorotrichaceae cyanobacterium]